MVLSLFDPDPSNFLRDFPGHNAENCDLIDEFAGACNLGDGLETYTPALGSTGTAPNLGTTGAVAGGHYYRIWNMVYVWGELRFGTAGTVFGTGIYTVTLPFPAKTLIGASTSLGAGAIIGNAYLHDESDAGVGGRQPAVCQLRTADTIMFGIRADSGGSVREAQFNAPFTWAVSDSIQFAVRYQRLE